MPTVLIVSAEDDTGGVANALMRALNRHTDWQAREIHRTQNYIGYPIDILWAPGSPKPDEIDDLFAAADVVHVMERWDAVSHYPDWRDKPLVIHHHGTIFREWNTQGLLVQTREFRAVPLVSTIDMTLIDPEAEWLPNPIDIGWMRRIRADEFRPHEGLLVAHSPTWRHLKGTDAFVSEAAARGLMVDVIEHTDWERCLRRKAHADIFYDQLTDGYGLSGIESMAMGIATIAGARDKRVIDLMLRKFGNLPFLLATPDTLGDMLGYLTDPDIRAASAAVSMDFMERWHDEAAVARQLTAVYQRAMEMRR
jgi:hypothetical protein